MLSFGGFFFFFFFVVQLRKDESDGGIGLGRFGLALAGKEYTPVVRNGGLAPR